MPGAISCIASPVRVAEFRYSRRDFEAAFTSHLPITGREDFEDAKELAGRCLCPDAAGAEASGADAEQIEKCVRELYDETVELVKRPELWRAIEAVADALLWWGRLSRTQVAAIIKKQAGEP